VKLALLASVARLLRLKISRAIPHGLAAIRVLASSARSAAADVTVGAITEVDARIVEAALTVVADVPTVADAPSLVARDSNAAPAPVALGTTAATREAGPVPRAVRSSFPRC